MEIIPHLEKTFNSFQNEWRSIRYHQRYRHPISPFYHFIYRLYVLYRPILIGCSGEYSNEPLAEYDCIFSYYIGVEEKRYYTLV